MGDLEGLRPSARPVVVAVFLNLALGGGLIGFPYARGQMRAADNAEHFARFAACLYGGEAAEEPGLGLPPGDEWHYASMVVRGASDWPDRCRPPLQAMRPAPATLLFPGLKSAELSLSRAIDLVDGELESLSQHRERARRRALSRRPLAAVGRLRAALAAHAIEAGVTIDSQRNAIALSQAPADALLARPSLVPLGVSSGGPWWGRVHAGQLEAGALDRTRVGHVVVSPQGAVSPVRTRRTSLVGALLPGAPGERPWVVLAMSAERCARDEAGCAGRSTGFTRLERNGQHLEAQFWFGAHPAADLERSFRLTSGTIDAIARGPEGLELRRGVRPPQAELGAQINPEIRRPIALTTNPVVSWLGADRALLVNDGVALVASLGPTEPEAAPVSLPAPPPGRSEVSVCAHGAHRYIAIGSRHGTTVYEQDDGQSWRSHSLALPVQAERRHLMTRCAAGRLLVVGLHEGSLRAAVCQNDHCLAVRALANRVGAFDVAMMNRRRTHVVWTGVDPGGPVLSAPMREQGRLEPRVVAACWDDGRGLCGGPRLLSEGQDEWLITREGEALRALRRRSGRWEALVGLPPAGSGG